MNREQGGQHSILVFIRGVPGSGKSFLADALEKSLGQKNVLILDPDKINKASKEYLEFSKDLSKENVDKKLHPFRWLRYRACRGSLEHKIIIWNQPFTVVDIFNRLVTFVQDYAKQHGVNLPVLLVEVELNHELAKERVLKRKQAMGHGPSESTLASRINDHKSYADQGYNFVAVKGDDDVSVSVATVTKKLRELQS